VTSLTQDFLGHERAKFVLQHIDAVHQQLFFPKFFICLPKTAQLTVKMFNSFWENLKLSFKQFY
jgi:hypothetical protein